MCYGLLHERLPIVRDAKCFSVPNVRGAKGLQCQTFFSPNVRGAKCLQIQMPSRVVLFAGTSVAHKLSSSESNRLVDCQKNSSCSNLMRSLLCRYAPDHTGLHPFAPAYIGLCLLEPMAWAWKTFSHLLAHVKSISFSPILFDFGHMTGIRNNPTFRSNTLLQKLL